MINYQKIKRFNDIIFSIILGFFLLPIILFFCLLVYLDDFKNPLCFGYRVGKNSKLFKIFKIRSMKKGSEKYSATTAKNDSRLTKIGRLIRFLKIDELPQLLNVFMGDMSFVGPRPEIKEYVDLYNENEKLALTVRPGITDYSSIKFISLFDSVGDGDADEEYKRNIFQKKNELRIYYVKNISFKNDLKILILTFLLTLKRIFIN